MGAPRSRARLDRRHLARARRSRSGPGPSPRPTLRSQPLVDAAAVLGQGPEQRGVLIVDVVDGPTEVQRVQLVSTPTRDAVDHVHFRLTEAGVPLCPASPSLLDVPPGNVMLGFPVIGDAHAVEVELVHVDATPSVYRRTLSLYQDRTGKLRTLGLVATPVGAAAMITGIVLLPLGLSKDSDGLTTAGGISLGVGTAIMTFGIWAIRRDAPTFRPGAANHFAF